MEYIMGDYKMLIEKCVSFAAQFICIPQTELLLMIVLQTDFQR